jgi:hypothetical protein
VPDCSQLFQCIEIARLLNIEHVGCNGHKFQLDCSDMVKGDEKLKVYLKYCQEMAVAIHGSVKNMAIVKRFTPVATVKSNYTCWTGQCATASNYTNALSDLVKSTKTNETTAKFASKLQKTAEHCADSKKKSDMLKEVNNVCLLVQTKFDPLNNNTDTIVLFDARVQHKKREAIETGDNSHILVERPFVMKRTKPGKHRLLPDWVFQVTVWKV